MAPPGRRTGLGIGALVAAVAWFFRDALFLRGAFFVQDVMVQNVPFRHHLHTALQRGELPLWVPEINAGFPLLAEGQVGALYPLNWLLAIHLAPWQAVNLSIVLHLMLATVTMWLFLRQLRACHVAALVGGLTYGLSGYLVVRAMSPNYLAVCAWLPLLFLFVERAMGEGRRGGVAGAALVFAVQLVAGHPQAAVYGLGAACLYALLRSRRPGTGRRLGQLFGAVALLGGLMGAAQLLPTWELASLSGRADGVGLARFLHMSLPPERLITLLLPSFFGTSAAGTYWGATEGFFIQLCPYLGAAAVPLMFIALSERREAASFALGVVALSGLLLSLGQYNGLFEWLYEVPGLRQFRIPTRFLLWWALAGAALAGLGADRLVRAPVRRRHAVACAVLIAACAWAGYAVISQVTATRLPAEAATRAALWRGELSAELGRTALMLSYVALLCLPGWRRRPRIWTAVSLSLPAVIFADLSAFGGRFNGTIDPAVYEDMPAAAAAIHADAATRGPQGTIVPPRIASLVTEANSGLDWHGGWRDDTAAYRFYPQSLRLYTGGLFGLANTMPGWSPLHLARHWDLARAHPALLRLASAEYVVLPARAAASAPGRRLSLPPASPVVVEELEPHLPRAYVVESATVLADAAQRLRLLRSRRFDPFSQVVVEEGAPLAPPVPHRLQPATIRVYEPTHVVVDVPPPSRAAYLVLTDTDYPGWQAAVDGAPVAIETANHVFRAVRLTSGARRVEFRFVAATFERGLWMSAFGAAAWVGLLWWARRRRPGAAPAPGAAASAFCSHAWLLQGTLILLLYGLASRTGAWMQWVSRCDVRSGFGLG